MKAALLTLVLILAFASSARADGAFDPPVPVRAVAPDFPYAMHRAGIDGFVLVNCLIDERGNVQDMKVEKASSPEFVQPAMDALRKWKFKPAERDGSKVSARVRIPIRFTIND